MKDKNPNAKEIARLEKQFAPKRPVPRSLREIEADKRKKTKGK